MQNSLNIIIYILYRIRYDINESIILLINMLTEFNKAYSENASNHANLEHRKKIR